MDDKIYTKHYVYKRNGNSDGLYDMKTDNLNKTSSEILENALKKAIKNKKEPKICKGCLTKLEYKGLGIFICPKCKTEVLSNYGMVRRVLDIHTTMTVREMCEITGLTKDDIKDLADEGSISVSSGIISTATKG